MYNQNSISTCTSEFDVHMYTGVIYLHVHENAFLDLNSSSVSSAYISRAM
ncbi:hypothetical protein Bca4012_087535 [Brassica carinata]